VEVRGAVPVARRFEDCLRRCEACRIGASNTINRPTYIYRVPLENIPVESREGASAALCQALNERNRETKRLRFGFSTSEDAVTWVVFTHLLRSGHLLDALKRSGLISNETTTFKPTLLLWGVPIDRSARGLEIRSELMELCVTLGENSNSLSEPDVIIDLGEHGIVFIEVKYLSGNERKPTAYHGWSRYGESPRLTWRFEDVKASGCYELARNWCLMNKLAAGRPAALVSLGSAKLFDGTEGERLDRFASALGTDERSHFMKVTWSDLLGNDLGGMPEWFVKFCRGRWPHDMGPAMPSANGQDGGGFRR
jgi:hypothetical protein